MAETRRTRTGAEPARTGAPLEPLPAANLDAEEFVLGAMMLSPAAIDRVLATGLDAGDYYRESHALIHRASVALHRLDKPVDALTVTDRLRESEELHRVEGGSERIREIASLVPATTNAAHHAELILKEARRRAIDIVGLTARQRVQEHVDPAEIQAELEGLLADLDARGGGQPLTGMTHAEVLALELPVDRYLIDDLIPAGAVGTIAAVPESHKSWLAQAIAVRVAAGQGWVLNRQITSGGPVGYLWQDDSTREEAERVKAFEQAHAQPADLPLRWFLNTGIQLPRDIARIRTTVEQHGLVLIVLDSYYNFLQGIDLKDDQAEQIVSLLKREICDTTGCTVLIVDHMPWATDTNRSRLRAYGGVFKNAATRFGIYIDIVGDKMHIEARGNNIRGFKQLSYWDKTDLELKLVQTNQIDDDSAATSAAKIADWVRDEHDGDVEIKYALAHFEISDDTLRRRIPRLRELGIEWVSKRGSVTRLVASAVTADNTEQAQLDLEVTAKVTAPHEPHAVTSALAASESHNHAGLSEVTASNRTDDLAASESADLQAKPQPQVTALYERESSPAATPSRDADETNGNGANGHRIADLTDDELERLASLAPDDPSKDVLFG